MATTLDASKLPRSVSLTSLRRYVEDGVVRYAKGRRAQFVGDAQDISKMGKFDIHSEPSQLTEVLGEFLVFKHDEILMPNDGVRTPIKQMFYLFHNDEIGFFHVKAHLTNMEVDGDLVCLIYRGNCHTVKQITEEEANIMFPHIFEDHHPSERI